MQEYTTATPPLDHRAGSRSGHPTTRTRHGGRHDQINAQAGLAATLSAASASATTGGNDRPIAGNGTGTISVDPATGAFTGVIPGFSSHLGKVDVQTAGVVAPTPDGTFAGSGSATIVAANGDELTGSITLTQEALPGGRFITTIELTITGGTGRFADATGDLTVICHSGPPDQVGGILVITANCEFTGQVSY
jgi:hypothetical protein